MSLEYHLIYVSIVVLISLAATVATFFAKDTLQSNRSLVAIYRKLEAQHRQALKRLDVYTCAVCLDQQHCKYAWNWHNTRGACLDAEMKKDKEA